MMIRTLASAAGAAVLAAALAMPAGAGAAPKADAPVATLTSVTVDPEDAAGMTTNAPGAWTTNLADPLSQVAVREHGVVLNRAPGLGEVAVPLTPGRHVLKLAGTGVFPGTSDYGLVLFFDGHQSPPDVAVFNVNPSRGVKLEVQPAGTVIMGGANGGLFFDVAPGSAVYRPAGGGSVEVTGWSVDAVTGATDTVGAYSPGADGTPDMVATVHLKVAAP